MPQLDKFTYFSQFFWLCLFLLIFYIPICNDGDGVLGISRILKLRNQLKTHWKQHEIPNLLVRIWPVIILLSVSFLLLWHLDPHFDMGGKLMRAICGRGLCFLFCRLGWFGLLLAGLFLLFDTDSSCNMMAPSGSSGGSNSISVGEGSQIGGSSRGSGWTSFDIGVIAEPFQNEEGEEVAQPNPPNTPANLVAPPGGANEPNALPQAPAPAEVAHPAPNAEEVSALRMELHALITERVREESERGVGPLSTQFPEQRELNSNVASCLMESLELDSELNPTAIREWIERVKDEPHLIKGLIDEYLPPKPKWGKK